MLFAGLKHVQCRFSGCPFEDLAKCTKDCTSGDLKFEDADMVLTRRVYPARSPEEVAGGLPEPVLARVQAEAGTPFDLAAGPLVRALLIRLAPDDHLLLLVMHHTVADGWSFKVGLDFCLFNIWG